jgi:steroid 5-alpha reductase family enzyme
MIGPVALLGGVLVAACLLMAAVWLLQRKTGDAGLVDLAWAGGIGAAAVAAALLGEGDGARRALVGAMGGVWGFRLAFHLWMRNHGKPEDSRYQDLRRQYGGRVQVFFFWFFQFQAVAIAVFAAPMVIAMRRADAVLTVWDGLGAAIWLLAVGGEALADAQLHRFRSDPANRGKTCRTGLWRVSRHPNYFFEWVHWFSYVSIGLAAPWGGLTLIGPALMLFFLYRVTGIPVTEQRALVSRGEDYRAYQRETSAFIPWFPRSGK